MSKVICDVCGTTFPETAAQCPICGCARSGSAQTAAGDSGAQAEAYSYVRGGRFSKSNVKKRNKTGQPVQRRSPESPKKNEGGDSSNKGLVIVVVILLLAIIAVCAYIGIKFFMPERKPNETDPPKQTTTVAPDPTQSQTQPTDGIPCTKIQLSSTIIEFTDMERSQLLSAVVTPLDTTDELVFTSADPLVATVTEGGLVTPVGSGETVITVTCGEITQECRIVCNFGDSTEPTEPEEPDMDAGTFQFIFNLKPDFVINDGMTGDVTLETGKSWKMYSSMNVDAGMVIWTSEDENYATIENGVVKAIASTQNLQKKYVLVHAEYAGVKYTCRIRVKNSQ